VSCVLRGDGESALFLAVMRHHTVALMVGIGFIVAFFAVIVIKLIVIVVTAVVVVAGVLVRAGQLLGDHCSVGQANRLTVDHNHRGCMVCSACLVAHIRVTLTL